MKINEQTNIAALIKAKPKALEAIVAISPRFAKLRNPILRKLLAKRTSISMASQIAGISSQSFFERIAPLGFIWDTQQTHTFIDRSMEKPEWLKKAKREDLKIMDVRPNLDAGKDPLKDILQQASQLQKGQILKITNTFKPLPLMVLLEKKGFDTFHQVLMDDIHLTYFYKKNSEVQEKPQFEPKDTWEDLYLSVLGNLHEIDVRDLPMPQPMHCILEKLEALQDEDALIVHHKKVPLFLLPELEERGFNYSIKQLPYGEVQLLIKNGTGKFITNHFTRN